jgi:hypothetical protein
LGVTLSQRTRVRVSSTTSVTAVLSVSGIGGQYRQALPKKREGRRQALAGAQLLERKIVLLLLLLRPPNDRPPAG